MKGVTLTERSNITYSPKVGDYAFTHKGEGYVVSTKFVSETKHLAYNLLEMINVFNQKRFTVKHTVFLDDSAPEGAVNWFFGD